MDPAHLAQQPEHLLILGQDYEGERLDSVIARDLAQDGQQRAAQPAPLELVDHRDGGLSHVGSSGAVIARDAGDALLAAVLVRGGDDCEAVVVVDHGQPVCKGVRKPLQGREEPEVHSALRHRRHRLDQQRLVLGDDRPDVNLASVGQLQDAGLETRLSHNAPRYGNRRLRSGSMGDVRRWRNLGFAAGAAAAALFAVFDVYQWLAAYASDRFHNDFTFYYAAARIGATHGWQSIYDLGLQQAQLNAMGSGIGVAQLARYISPPPVAWLALPFTLLPYPIAYWTWSSLLLIALIGTWYLAAPGAGRLRLIHLLAALAWVPVIYGLQLGQPGIFVALGVAGSYALLRSGRSFEAGLALGTIVLKPQLGFLVPIALLVAGRYRAFAGAVA